MRDLSREEKLSQRIYQLEEASEDDKWRRTKTTFFVLSAAVYLIAFMCDGMNCLQDYLLWILAAPISAGFIMFISFSVTFYMFAGAIGSVEQIARLQGELDAIKRGDYE